MSRLSRIVLFPLLAMLLLGTLSGLPVHALGETYTLTESTPRLQESSTASVLLILNVSNANVAANYQFTWHVKSPSGTLTQANNQTNAPHAASFVESAAYPTRFGAGANLAYVGVYSVWINQTQPPMVGSTGIASSQFLVGLTDSLSYQRTFPVSIKAAYYSPGLNVTVKISGSAGTVSGFPLNKTADNTGSLSYNWPSIPASLPVGSYTLTLTGSPSKSPSDIQAFNITATSVAISTLTISKSVLQTSQTEDFRFTATYPNSVQVRTGSVNLRLVEGDGITSHYVSMTYSSTLGVFHGTFQIPLSSEIGPWVATVEVNSFDDGYGNKGPISGTYKPFTVSPAILAVSVITNANNYTTGGIVGIYASVITPGGYKFTIGNVTATTYYASRQVGSPLQTVLRSEPGQVGW